LTASINSYRDLVAWQKAMLCGLRLHRLAGTLPDSERFGLVSQIRRGSVAVASNIAEGYGRGSTGDYVRFLKMARGCLYELDTQLLFCVELAYLGREIYDDVKRDLDESERVLAGLIRSLERRSED
jgi:four helix bundle protein